MRAVAQHDLAQAGSGFRSIHGAPKAVFVQQGQISRMVDMGVRQQHAAQFCRVHRQRDILEPVFPLLHPAVHQESAVPHLQQGAAPRNLMRGADKRYLHGFCISLFRGPSRRFRLRPYADEGRVFSLYHSLCRRVPYFPQNLQDVQKAPEGIILRGLSLWICLRFAFRAYA